MGMKKGLASLMLASSITSVNAIEFAGNDWEGVAELGAVVTYGNTETQTLNGKLGVTNDRDKWRHNVQLETLKATSTDNADNDTTTAERYLISGKSDFKFSSNKYAFATIQYEDDRFSGLNYRTTEAIGYGQRIIERKTLLLDLEVGPGARQSQPKGVDGNGESLGLISEFIVRAAGRLEWKITNTTAFSQALVSDFGDDSTLTKSVTALAAQIVGNLAMKVSLTLRLNSDPPSGVQKDDAESALTLVYNF